MCLLNRARESAAFRRHPAIVRQARARLAQANPHAALDAAWHHRRLRLGTPTVDSSPAMPNALDRYRRHGALLLLRRVANL